VVDALNLQFQFVMERLLLAELAAGIGFRGADGLSMGFEFCAGGGDTLNFCGAGFLFEAEFEVFCGGIEASESEFMSALVGGQHAAFSFLQLQFSLSDFFLHAFQCFPESGEAFF
jgi:hypothetical protein